MAHTSYRGFSTLEILLAGAVFAVFAWGVVEVALSGLSTDRLGQETTLAAEYAAAGMEAVRAVKEDNFDALIVTAGVGLTQENDAWVFSGTENVLDEKYTRVIVIETGKRDEDGNITEGEGNEDPDTFRVTVTVTWQMSPTRDNRVVLETYFTRWRP